MSNQVAQRPKFSAAIQTDAYKKLINNTLQDPKRAQRFIGAISSAVAINPELQTCDAGTILSGALLGESLNLSPSPQLGEYYLVPFEDRKNNRRVATFVLGYKGIKQLAMNTGLYKSINVVPVKKGELIRYDPFENIFVANPIEDPLERETAETVGYYAYYQLLNGFKECLYWSKERMERHALRYSKGYAAKKGYTMWEKDFDSMARKTMYRQLLSTAPKSIEMRQAFEVDETLTNADGTPQYIGDDMPEPEDLLPDSEIPFAEPEPEQGEGRISMSDL